VGTHRAGLLLIMAYTAREMDKGEIDPGSMRKSAELAMSELSINEVRNNHDGLKKFLPF